MTDLVREEGIRARSSAEKLAGLKTVFRAEDGTVTAGNASPLSDGASAAWVGSEAAAGLLGLDPLALIAGRGEARDESVPLSQRGITKPSRGPGPLNP